MLFKLTSKTGVKNMLLSPAIQIVSDPASPYLRISL